VRPDRAHRLRARRDLRPHRLRRSGARTVRDHLRPDEAGLPHRHRLLLHPHLLDGVSATCRARASARSRAPATSAAGRRPRLHSPTATPTPGATARRCAEVANDRGCLSGETCVSLKRGSPWGGCVAPGSAGT
jgi:hypothetical protein